MWSHLPLRLCMAAMAPALTDAVAHTGSFKLPASPANPGTSGLQASPSQPTSPDLPSLANGHSPAVPDIVNHYPHKLEEEERSPPTCFNVRFLENNNHKTGRTERIEQGTCNNIGVNGNGKSPIKHRLNSLLSTIGTGLVANGEGHSIQVSQKTMSSTPVSLAHKGENLLNDSKIVTSPRSKMPPLTISMTGSPTPAVAKNSVTAGIESGEIRSNASGDPGDVDELGASCDSSSSSMSNDLDSSSLSMSMSLSTALTTDTSLEQAIDESVEVKSTSDSDSDDSSLELHTVTPSKKPVVSPPETKSCDVDEKKEKSVPDLKVQKEEKVREHEKIVFEVDIDSAPSSDISKQTSDLMHKQSKLEHRAKYLVEKLRRLQTCHVGSHIYHQIGSFVESKQSKESESVGVNANSGCDECRRNRLQVGNRPGILPRSSSSHSHTCSFHTSSERQRHTARPSWLPPGKRTKQSTHISQHLREGKQAYREVKSVTGRLQASLGHVESTIDSDVTDSSSGGESCDEGDDSLPQSQASRSFHKMPLHRRASWKWAMDRAAIASKWTWLQAQVSDLEYRIRQQSDIFRQIRATKGSVTLGEPPSPDEYLSRSQVVSNKTGRKLSPLETKIVMLEGSNSLSPSNLSSLLSNVDKQSAKLKQSLQTCVSPFSPSPSPTSAEKTTGPLNGLTDNMTSSTLCGANTSSSPNVPGMVSQDQVLGSPAPAEEQYCARTRPVRQFRKRKLIRSMGLYQVCRKAQKLSSVRCGCFPPLTSCVMCGGRFNNVEHFDADQTTSQERVASLEYAFHSVLSFPEEIPLSLHFESLLKSGAWQRKHGSRSLGKKKHRLPNRSRVKAHAKDNRFKKFRKKERRNQKQLSMKGSGDAGRKREQPVKKEAPEREVSVGTEADKDQGVVPEEDAAAKSRKLLHRLARQKLKALRQNRSEKYLSRSQSSSLPGTPKNALKTSELRQSRSDIKNRSAHALANAAIQKNRERSMSLPNKEVGDAPPPTSAPSTPVSAEARSPTQQLSHSLPAASLQGILRNKKGVVESYDIDNIVIPYSMLASTRVVKLNYKEIDTPKWREVDPEEMTAEGSNREDRNPEDGSQEDSNRQNNGLDDEEEENLSDSEFTGRHEPCESMEKQKFLVSFVDHGIPGRRSRRSRHSSIGSATEPHSPDLQFEHLPSGRHSSASPTPSPSPITTPDQLTSSTGSSVFNLSGGRSLRFSALNRRRSSSVSEAHAPNTSHVCKDEDVVSTVWVKRQFPLDNAELEDIATYPYPESEPSTRPSSRASNATHPESVASRTESQDLNLHMSDGENSEPEAMEVDDPNDPEWTVVEDQQRVRKLEGASLSESLVLKLAKR